MLKHFAIARLSMIALGVFLALVIGEFGTRWVLPRFILTEGDPRIGWVHTPNVRGRWVSLTCPPKTGPESMRDNGPKVKGDTWRGNGTLLSRS